MKIMGMTDFPYWLSWLTYYIILNTLQCLLMTLLLIPVFEYTNKFILFIHLWIYGMSVFGYCIFISAFFSSPKAAGMAGIMLFFSLSFCITIVGDRSVSETSKNFASLFSSLAVQLGGINLLKYEEVGLGVTFNNANDVYENYRFGTCLWMNLISFFLFSVLGIYLENVLPSAVGVRKPLWFPFTKSFWFDTKKNTPENTDNEDELSRRNSNKIRNSSHLEGSSQEHVDIDLTNFEEVPEYLKIKEADQEFVRITNLKKNFDKFWAVDGLYSEMYEGQIFALLGHNGAGKTTTINILCGMIA